MDGADGGAQVETFQQAVEGIREEGGFEPVRLGVQTWKCDEHTKTDWACRYCVAQAVVEGELTPVVGLVEPIEGNSCLPVGDLHLQPTVDVDADVARSARDIILVWARVVTFSRKLSWTRCRRSGTAALALILGALLRIYREIRR